MRLTAVIASAMCIAVPVIALAVSTTDPVNARTKVDYPNVRKVECIGGSGTAFRTEKGWISVAHVTSLFGCSIDASPIGAEPEGSLDFSRVSHIGQEPKFPINCDGFKAGTYVWAIGYAGGAEWQTMTRHYVTYKDTDDGMRFLLGSPAFIPGMSGGPVLNEKGEVVGVINAYSKLYPISFSRPLKDTSLCRHS